MDILKRLKLLLLSSLLTVGLGTPVAMAEPPPWAPAHGYRAKQKHGHDHDRGHYHYDRSRSHGYFGILDGHCNHEAIGTVLGGAIGGAVGGHAAGDGDRTLSTIAGVIVGAVIGNTVGRAMDDADRYCTGHALEFAEPHQTVSWYNPKKDRHYHVTPLEARPVGDRYCREFTVRSGRNGPEETQLACRTSGGTWKVID